jgi:hypothetical protein
MKNDFDLVPVLFRAERSGKFKGDVTAVFPTLPADYEGREMTCYAHIGQHSACSFDWYRKTRPATPKEFGDLAMELLDIGYRFRIYSRITPQLRELFRRETWRRQQ